MVKKVKGNLIPEKDQHVVKESLRTFGKRNMTTYAVAVNLDRSVPDLYDGLKPVQRRILWAASKVAKHQFEKTARLAGECFAAGTQVATPFKYKAIEKIKVGNRVITDKGIEKVTKVFHIPNRELYEIVTNQDTIQATPDQIFYCFDVNHNEKEIIASELKSGDSIISIVYEVPIEVVSVKKLPGLHTVYDIEVANRHRFYANGMLVHNCMGKYHPHGSTAIEGAVEVMVQHPTPTLLGKGNWGSMTDPAAAARYTNCKLSGYGQSFFNTDYINDQVTSFVPNYDDKDIEPVTLPAQLPNVLLNGGEGIGVGITTVLPTFTPESVIDVLTKLFSGKKLEIIDFAKTLKFNHKWGGHVVKNKENKQQWLQMFKSSTGNIQFESDIIVDRDKKSILINDWPPGTNLESFVKKIRAMPECQRCYNSKGSTTFTIECKSAYNFVQFDKFVEKVQKATQQRKSFKINVTKREASTVDGITTFDTKFLALSIPQLIMQWCRMRVALELKSLAYRITKQNELIKYCELLIYAVDKLDLIFKALKTKNPDEALIKYLKITPEQAKQILDLQVRRLSKLDQDQLKEKLKEDKKHLKQLLVWQKKPKSKVLLDLEHIKDVINKDRQFKIKDETQELTIV